MDLLQRSVAEYEKEFEMLEKYQITDPQDPDFGVVAQNCGSAAAKPMTLYFCPQSRYYKDPRALACADGLVGQVSYGTIVADTLEYYKNVPLRPTGYGQNLALMMLVELLVWDAQGLL